MILRDVWSGVWRMRLRKVKVGWRGRKRGLRGELVSEEVLVLEEVEVAGKEVPSSFFSCLSGFLSLPHSFFSPSFSFLPSSFDSVVGDVVVGTATVGVGCKGGNNELNPTPKLRLFANSFAVKARLVDFISSSNNF